MRTVRGRWAALALALTAFVAMLGLTPGVAMAAERNVARVGDKDYATVDEALKHADEGTIYLLADVSDVVVLEETTATIDLGGHTVSAVDGHAISNNGVLTIVGSGTVDGGDKSGCGAVYTAPGATTTLNGGAYTGSKWYVIKNLGAMIISEGVSLQQEDAGSSAIDNGYYGNPGNDCGVAYPGPEGAHVSLTITGGSFSGGMNTVKNDDFGILSISGGSFSNTVGPVMLNWNKADISGGTFTSSAPNLLANGYLSERADAGKLTITGGTFVANEHGALFTYPEGASEGGAIVISGGSFEGKLVIDGEQENYPNLPEITGGTFTDDVSEYVPEDYELNEDGTVTELPDIAKIGDTSYKSLEAAVAAATDGDVIELVADATVGESMTLAANNVTIKGNGHTVTAVTEGFVTNDANGGAGNRALLTVTGNGCAVENVKMVGNASTSHLINLYSSASDKVHDFTVKDVSLNHSGSSTGAAMVVAHCAVTAEGSLEVIVGSNSWGGVNLDNKYGDTSFNFAENSSLTYTDASNKDLPFGYTDINPAVDADATFTSDSQNVGVEEGVHSHNSDKIVGYIAPTTKSEGYSGDVVCSICDKVMIEGEVIPRLQPGEIVMFRLYNPNSGEHFYTASEYERDSVVKAGWDYEGVGWIAPDEGDPVYRLYNPNAGDHHYTTSAFERDSLVRAGWDYEGIGWYSADKENGVPLLREYNPNAATGTHNYTVSQFEHDYLVSIGWNDEGIAWYAVK